MLALKIGLDLNIITRQKEYRKKVWMQVKEVGV
jgi:hypothetical protein